MYDSLRSRTTGAFQSEDLSSRLFQTGIMKIQKVKESEQAHTTLNAKNLLPAIHNKTHFKAITSVFTAAGAENSLVDHNNIFEKALKDAQYNNEVSPRKEEEDEVSNFGEIEKMANLENIDVHEIFSDKLNHYKTQNLS